MYKPDDISDQDLHSSSIKDHRVHFENLLLFWQENEVSLLDVRQHLIEVIAKLEHEIQLHFIGENHHD